MWEKLKGWAQALEDDGITLWFCCKHPQMPWLPKILALCVVAYFLSPIDLIPDFIPVLGYLDELILLPISIYFILKLVPRPVLADCRQQAAAWMAAHHPTPTSIAGAIAIMVLWMLLFAALWQCFGAGIMQWFRAG
jgi:uncharacterized membrane protein YkvA (DUF1232 family)